MSTAAGPVSQHAFHLGTLAGPVVLLAFWASWSEVRAWIARTDLVLPTAALVAAVLSVGAAVIHAVVIPPHLAESAQYGAFFAALTLAQLGWAALVVVRPRSWTLASGIAGNLGTVVLWAATRTAGIPMGVAAGQREPIGVLDTTCCLLELGIVGCCLWLLTHRPAAVRA